MAKALTVPSLSSPTRSVSLAEYRRVPAAFKARQLGLVPISWMPAGVIAPVARSTRKQVDAAAIAGRQIHLRRQHIAERRAEGADIGDERPGGFVRSRLERTGDERGCPRQCDGGFQE